MTRPSKPGPGSASSSRREAGVPSMRMLAWCTTRALPGRNSMPRTYRVLVTEMGITKFRSTSDPPPAFGQLRRRREIGPVAFDGAFLDPPLDGFDLSLCQPPGAGEFRVARLRLPGWHAASAR